MKIFRTVYFAALYVNLGAALYSGARVLYVLAFIQLFLLLGALVMNLWSAFTFAYIQEISETASTRGETVVLHLEIHNERPLPFPLMRIRVRTLDPGKNWSSTFNLAAQAHVAFDIPIHCLYRGDYRIGLAVVDIRDIFGLLNLPFQMDRLPYYREKRLLVHPRVTQLPERSSRPPDAKAYARFSTLHTDTDESFSHTREYRPGDRARQIHWKLSARQGRLYSRQYDVATEPSMVVLIDASPGRYTGEAALQWQDTACSCAATLVAHVLHRRYLVTLAAVGKTTVSVRGVTMADFPLFDHALTHLQFDGNTAAKDILTAEADLCRTHGSIVLITHSEPGTQLMDAFRPLRRTDADIAMITALPASFPAPAAPSPQLPIKAEEWTQESTGIRMIRAAYGDDLRILLGDFV
jgi:uncharacterized protein (DUF58 family)